MNHNTDNREDEEVGETANKLAWLEEKLAGTTDKEERKAIEASILLAQTAHKQALIKGAANSRRAKANDADGDTDMISKRVAEVVILDEDEDSDHDMSTDNNKRRNGDETEMTDKEKKSKADQEGWAISPKGGCNGNGGVQGRGKGKGNGGEEAKMENSTKLSDYLPKTPTKEAKKNNVTQSQNTDEGNSQERANSQQKTTTSTIKNPYTKTNNT